MKLTHNIGAGTWFIALAMFIVALSGSCEGAPKGLKVILEETSTISDEISLLNLINGLNLDAAQLGKLVELNRRANDVRDRAVEKARPIADDFMVAMEKLRAALLEESNKTEVLGNEAAGLKQRLKEIAEECSAEVAALASEASKVLSETQLLAMENFKPCIVPPKNFKDPVRVGQAASSAGKQRVLKKVRGMPENQYLKRRERLIDNLIARSEKRFGALSDAEKASLKNKAIEIADRVRSMEDADFQADLDKLADELKPPQAAEIDELDELRKKVQSRKPNPGALTRWFFSPGARQVLEAKAARLDRYGR